MLSGDIDLESQQSIRIASDIEIIVVKVGYDSVRLGIEAPPHATILRSELRTDAISAKEAKLQETRDRHRLPTFEA